MRLAAGRIGRLWGCATWAEADWARWLIGRGELV